MKWKQSAITIAGGNQPGRDVHQLFWPQGIYIDSDRTIYVADYGNNRIIEWKSNAEKGVIMAGRSGFGAGNNQLNQATDVIFDEKDHFLLICDWGNKRVVRKSDDNEEILIPKEILNIIGQATRLPEILGTFLRNRGEIERKLKF